MPPLRVGRNGLYRNEKGFTALPQRVSLLIPQHRQIVFIGLNGKPFESHLADMATAFVVPILTASVRRHQPQHPATEVSLFMRPQQHEEMVCHPTIPG